MRVDGGQGRGAAVLPLFVVFRVAKVMDDMHSSGAFRSISAVAA